VRSLSHAFFFVKGLIGGPNQSHKVNLKEHCPHEGKTSTKATGHFFVNTFPDRAGSALTYRRIALGVLFFRPAFSGGALEEGRGTMRRSTPNASTFATPPRTARRRLPINHLARSHPGRIDRLARRLSGHFRPGSAAVSPVGPPRRPAPCVSIYPAPMAARHR